MLYSLDNYGIINLYYSERMRMTKNNVLIRKYIDELSRNAHDTNRRFENLKTAQKLVNILEEIAQIPSVMLK